MLLQEAKLLVGCVRRARELDLNKALTTLGRPGVQVARDHASRRMDFVHACIRRQRANGGASKGRRDLLRPARRSALDTADRGLLPYNATSMASFSAGRTEDGVLCSKCAGDGLRRQPRPIAASSDSATLPRPRLSRVGEGDPEGSGTSRSTMRSDDDPSGIRLSRI